MIQNGTEMKPAMFLPNLFFIATLFPFVSPYPIQTDTQPVTCIIAIIILLLDLPKKFKLGYAEGLALVFAIFGLLYLNPSAEHFFPSEIGKYFAIVAGASTFIIAKRYYRLFSSKVFYYSTIVYFVLTILYMFNPQILVNFQTLIVRGVNVDTNDVFGYRGALTLSTEPGLFGGLLIYFFLLLEFFNKKNAFTLFQKKFIFAILFFMILATKSGTGYLYFCLYLVTKLARLLGGKKFLLIFFIVVFLFVSVRYLLLIAPSLPNLGRGFDLLFNVIINPDALLFDTSIVGRVMDFIMGPLSLISFPLGVGANEVSVTTMALTARFDILRDYYGITNVGLVSGTTWLLMSSGIFALFFLILFYAKLSKASWEARFFSFLFLAISFSPAFPPVWVLLAEPSNLKNRKVFKKQIYFNINSHEVKT